MNNKNFKILIICLILSGAAFGQEISLSIAQNHSGKNIQLGLGYNTVKKLFFETGLKYHINNSNDWDSRGFKYFYNFHASKPSEHFGIFHLTKYKLYTNAQNSNLYLFHNIHFNHLAIKGESFELFGDVDPIGSFDSNGNAIYYKTKYLRPAIFTIENHIGIGIKTNFSERLAVQLEAGTGIAHFWDSEYLYIDPATGEKILLDGSFNWDPFAPHLRVGLIFKLIKDVENKD